MQPTWSPSPTSAPTCRISPRTRFSLRRDEFQRPNPFTADIVVAIDDVIEKKLAAIEALESQFYEGAATVGPTWSQTQGRGCGGCSQEGVRDEWSAIFLATAKRFRVALANTTRKTARRRSASPRHSRSASTAAGQTRRN